MHRPLAAYAGLSLVLLSREDRPDGWVQNRLSRAPPITECLFERRASHHVPTVWLLASRSTIPLFIRLLLD
jgi:hypothetical protein